MAMIKVKEDYCKGCGLCIGTCPQSILTYSRKLNNNGEMYCEQTDSEKCTGCTFCGMICPESAIEVYR